MASSSKRDQPTLPGIDLPPREGPGPKKCGAQLPIPGLFTESPAEARILAAFLASGSFGRLKVTIDSVAAHGPAGTLFVQPWVTAQGARFRLDFALVDPTRGAYIVIEVDGHPFHERTREQAQRDRARERKLVAAGWTVLRFTAAEVGRSAAACVAEVLDVAARVGRVEVSGDG